MGGGSHGFSEKDETGYVRILAAWKHECGFVAGAVVVVHRSGISCIANGVYDRRLMTSD